MDKYSEQFSAEQVDEQIERLSLQASFLPDARFVHDLRDLYEEEEDARSLGRVWERLNSSLAAHDNGMPAGSEESQVLNEKQAVLPLHKQPRRSSRFTLVAAVLIMALLVGSLIGVLRIVHRNPSTPAATPQVQQTATPSVQKGQQSSDAYNKWAAANGVMFGYNAQHTHYNPFEQILNAKNVAKLRSHQTFSSVGRIEQEGLSMHGGIAMVGTVVGCADPIEVSGCVAIHRGRDVCGLIDKTRDGLGPNERLGEIFRRRRTKRLVNVGEMLAIEFVEINVIGGMMLGTVPPVPVTAFGN